MSDLVLHLTLTLPEPEGLHLGVRVAASVWILLLDFLELGDPYSWD